VAGHASAADQPAGAAWHFSDEAEFYEQAAMLGLRLALTAPGQPCRASRALVERLDPAWLIRA
jgi:hypothetical protein